MDDSDREAPDLALDEPLYFFPDREVTGKELARVLSDGTESQRAEAISHLLRYAEWGHIWRFVSRDEVRDIFDSLDLPDSLRQAWARMLNVERPVAPTE